MITSLWRLISNGWSSARHARLLYLVFTAGFVAMAIGGAIKGDSLVLALGVVFAGIAASIALLAPKLALLFGPRDAEREP